MSRKVLIWSMLLTIAAAGGLSVGFAASAPTLALFSLKTGFLLGAGSSLGIWGLRRFAGASRTDAILLRAAVLSLLFACFLATGELAVRFAFRHITTTSDNTSYFARRWTSHHVRLNAWGFRERTFSASKPEHFYRVALVGDSFAFGQGIREEERFGNLVERHLNASGGNVEVLNFGRPGAETIDHIDILQDAVLKVHPDYVLLQWYVNDYEESWKNSERRRANVRSLWPHWTKVYLHRYSALYYLLDRQWFLLQQALGFLQKDDLLSLKAFEDPNSAESVRYRERLESFIRLCREEGMGVGVVLFPHRTKHAKDYPYAGLHALVADTFRRAGAESLDLRAAYTSGTYTYDELSVNIFDGHPGALANRIAADKILDHFGGFWLSEHRKKTEVSE